MEVYAVMKNEDMTEGRGPFKIDKIFSSAWLAWKYANTKKGVMGRGPARDHAKLRAMGYPKFIGMCPGWLCQLCWPYGGDWRVETLTVYDELPEEPNLESW